jgi:tetratricopeptide (TPR) repeat protein
MSGGMPISPLVQQGLAHHDAGRLTEAEALYRQALAQSPQDFDALRLLGVVAAQTGRTDEAIATLERALQLRPNSADALVNLGVAMNKAGRYTDAAAAYQRAIQINPKLSDAHSNLGNALRSAGRLNDAIRAYVAAIELEPTHANAQSGLASALIDKGFTDDAIAICRRAIAQHPNFGLIYVTLTNALTVARQYDEAVAAGHRAVELRPDLAEAHHNLGYALSAAGDYANAAAAYRRAIALKPSYPEAYSNLAVALEQRADYDGAITAARRGIELNPDHAESHSILSMLLLRSGDFKAGWPEHQWRWKAKNLQRHAPRYAQPLWDGRDLAGRTLLIHNEQGFGDAIQFIRYLPMILARGQSRVVMQSRAQLIRLFHRLPGIAAIGETVEELPPFETHCSLMDLPAIFETELATIPVSVPYLSASAVSMGEWEPRLAAGAPPGMLRVGLAWAGNPQHPNDRARSIPLPLLRRLARVPNVRFYTLQVGPAPSKPGDAPELAMVDHTAELRDFAETAAMVSCLDLVIGPDTAIVHLAGALARPVWMMLPFVPDWRWMLDRTDSPWYPTMRLFRQPVVGDWDSVVAAVAEALAALAAQNRAAHPSSSGTHR